MTKYRAKRVVVDGIAFDSKREAARWSELKLMERAGLITALTRQESYVLAQSVKLDGDKRARPPIRYLADFKYIDRDAKEWVVEDVKGHDTPMSRLKRHLMATVHGIVVRIVR
jgi:hypothetical protein